MWLQNSTDEERGIKTTTRERKTTRMRTTAFFTLFVYFTAFLHFEPIVERFHVAQEPKLKVPICHVDPKTWENRVQVEKY